MAAVSCESDAFIVLQLVMQHSDYCSSMQDLCAVLMVSKQLTVSIKAMTLHKVVNSPDTKGLKKYRAFCHWLHVYGPVLTRLSLHLPQRDPFFNLSLEPISTALLGARLLRKLEIMGLGRFQAGQQQLNTFLSTLACLHSLVLSDCWDCITPQCLHMLPHSLKELRVSGQLGPSSYAESPNWRDAFTRAVRHLTALSSLRLHDTRSSCTALAVKDASVRLPPGLTSLDLASTKHIEPILQLKSLRRLAVRGCHLSPADLVRLTTLEHLEEVEQLRYNTLKDVGFPLITSATGAVTGIKPGGSNFLSRLPLVGLHIANMAATDLAPWLCRALYQASQLTALQLNNCGSVTCDSADLNMLMQGACPGASQGLRVFKAGGAVPRRPLPEDGEADYLNELDHGDEQAKTGAGLLRAAAEAAGLQCTWNVYSGTWRVTCKMPAPELATERSAESKSESDSESS